MGKKGTDGSFLTHVGSIASLACDVSVDTTESLTVQMRQGAANSRSGGAR